MKPITLRTVTFTAAVLLSALLVLAGTGCVSVPAGEPLPPARPGVTGLLLIAHGSGNNPSNWPARLIRQIRNSGADISRWEIYAHDWEAEANKVLTAARNGNAIGREMARRLIASGDQYQVLHLVGQSMGAHLTQGFADEYRRLQGRAYIQMTFMDPFLIRGVFGFGHGVRQFGRGADFAENFLVRHEPMLGTNRYLRHAHNIDITALVWEDLKDDFFGPHWWVVAYYRQSVVNEWPGFDRSPIAAGILTGYTAEGQGTSRGGTAGGFGDYFAALRAALPAGERIVLEAD
ncbi:MAG: hypothetical protein V3S41_08985 [Spirochaetia bacterium]